jgi:hypothetical protein
MINHKQIVLGVGLNWLKRFLDEQLSVFIIIIIIIILGCHNKTR